MPGLTSDILEELDYLEDYNLELVDDFIPPSPPRRATVEDIWDDDEIIYGTAPIEHYVEPYPGEAGQGMHISKMQFKIWLEEQEVEGKNPWEPFVSKEEWVLTQWLIKNVGQKATDEYLNLPIVR